MLMEKLNSEWWRVGCHFTLFDSHNKFIKQTFHIHGCMLYALLKRTTFKNKTDFIRVSFIFFKPTNRTKKNKKKTGRLMLYNIFLL